jgi:hypothetical protein
MRKVTNELKVFKSSFEHEAELKFISLPLFVRNVYIQTSLCLFMT